MFACTSFVADAGARMLSYADSQAHILGGHGISNVIVNAFCPVTSLVNSDEGSLGTQNASLCAHAVHPAHLLLRMLTFVCYNVPTCDEDDGGNCDDGNGQIRR